MAKYAKKKPVERVPFELGFAPSMSQLAIESCFEDTKENIFCEAVAGSGKSSTLAFIMRNYTGKGAYIAFNKDIVTEMEPKCPPNIAVKTRHAFGYGAFMSEGIRPNLNAGKDKLDHILEKNGFAITKEDPDSYDRVKNIKTLIDQMRNNLIDERDHVGIDRMLYFYNIDIDEIDSVKVKLPIIFERIVELGMEGIIDFVDMKWLPVRLDWRIRQFPVLFLDEYQDSSNLDMAFDKKMISPGGRVVIVGDGKQSIYGFAGANCDSIEVASSEFEATKFPLHVTFRCAKAVVDQAKKIVPYIEAWDNSPDGKVNRMEDPFEPSEMDPDAMVLCRRNAPLVAPCFKALKAGVKANIKGRDIGANLISIVNKLKCGDDLSKMRMKLEDYMEQKRRKILDRPKPSAFALEMLDDQQNILEAFAEEPEIGDVPTLKRYIKKMFTMDGDGMVFSSVHRSKGLEADHVVILDYPNIRIRNDRMTDEARQQEANLEYVALTRAKGNLHLDVSTMKK